MKIGMVGCGKLGLPLCLAMEQRGHTVIGYDVNPAVAGYVSARKIPYEEEGANEALETTRFRMVELDEVLSESEIVFVAVQTPHKHEFEGTVPITDRRVDFDYTVLRQTLADINDRLCRLDIDRTIVVISTVLPGTMRRYVMPGLSKHVRLCYSPSFIAMGTAMRDFLFPELVLFGQDSPIALEQAQRFFKTITDAPLFPTSIENAELIKVSYNTMIGMKIAFANTLMEICHKTPGTNVDAVVDALSLAKRRLISAAYLRGGMGDGGGCLLPGGLVYTEHGVSAIEDIEAGDLVLASDGRLRSVVDTYKRPYQGAVYRIKARGLPSMVLTPEHPVKVARDLRKTYETGGVTKRVTTNGIEVGAHEEIPARELSDDYYVRTPVPVDVSRNGLPAGYDAEALSLLGGIYLGDGSLDFDRRSTRRHAKRVEFHLNTTTKDDLVARVIGLVARLAPGASPKIMRNDDKHTQTVRVNSVELAGLIDAQFGHGHSDKSIPSWALYGPLELARQMLYGMFRTDGSSHPEGLSFSTTSVQLAHGMTILLRRFGIPSTFAEQKPRTTPDGTHHMRAFQVEVSNAVYLEALHDLLKIPLQHQMQDKRYEGTCFVRDGFVFHKIQDIAIEEYEGTVYNLNVEGTHDYVTPGGAVNNCHPRDNIALSWLARELELSHDFFYDIMMARENQTAWLADLIIDEHRRTGFPITILGAAFKANTNITTGSPALLLAHFLKERGYEFDMIDPLVVKGRGGVTKTSVEWHTIYDSVRGVGPQVFFIATAHDCWGDWVPAGSVVLDPWRKYEKMGDPRDNMADSVRYIPIGGLWPR